MTRLVFSRSQARTTLRILAAGLILALPQAAFAQAMNVSVQTSRTSGVAPLAVFFDSSQTTHTNGSTRPFRDLAYSWDFDDPTAGTWAHSAEPKNVARGPLAGHVFDKAGSYDVTVTVRDAAGNQSTKTVRITATDPNSHYSGTKTICASATGNFSGCPGGALRVTESDFDTVLRDHVATNRRILYRRGDTFQTSQKNSFATAGPITIGAFGSGARPVVRLTNGIGTDGNIQLGSAKTHVVRDWRIMDLDMRSALYDGEVAIKGGARVEDLLIYRVGMTDYPNGLGFFSSILEYWGVPIHKGLFAIDVDMSRSGPPPNAASYPITWCGEWSALMGSSSLNTGSPTHVFRISSMKRSVIQHNDLQNPKPGRAVIKMHSPPWHKGYGYTEEVVVSHNRLNGGSTNWLVTMAPENVSSDERVRRIIAESNYFTTTGSAGGRIGMYVAADEVTVRNNVFNFSGDTSGGKCIQFTRRGIEPAHFGNEAEHNTCYDGDSGVSVTAVGVGTANSYARDNLAVAANPSATGTGSLALTASPFIAASPTDKAQFQLKTGSAPVDAASGAVFTYYDASGALRPQDGSGNGVAVADVGAFELSGGGGGGTTLQPPAAPTLLP